MAETAAWRNRERLVQVLGIFLLTFSLVLYSTYLWEAWSPALKSQSLWAPRVSNPVALAWLWREASRGGWLPLEKLLLLLAWFTPLLTFLMMVGLKLSVGPLYLAMTMVVLLRRYFWEQTAAGRGQAAPPGLAVKSDTPGRN